MLPSIGIIIVTSAAIWWFSDKLEAAADAIGRNLNIPESVKGAVLYAVPSSFPEFCTAIIAVLALEEAVFEVGVGTIAGSAVFNILLIPALSLLVARAAFKRKGESMNEIRISPHVFMRDGVFYLVVVAVFLVIAFQGELGKGMALVLLGMYGAYIIVLAIDTRRHQKGIAEGEIEEQEDAEMSLGVAVIWMVLAMGGVGVACYFLVESTIEVAAILEVNAYLVAVIITAAATSVPDTLISIGAAKRSGEESEASVVNAFSSNIFDVLVCLSVPALLYPGTLTFDKEGSIVSIVLLAVITLITLVVIRIGNRVTVPKAIFLLAMYVVFVVSAIFNDQILALFI